MDGYIISLLTQNGMVNEDENACVYKYEMKYMLSACSDYKSLVCDAVFSLSLSFDVSHLDLALFIA